jgi:septation ring formation regulator EzrA
MSETLFLILAIIILIFVIFVVIYNLALYAAAFKLKRDFDKEIDEMVNKK